MTKISAFSIFVFLLLLQACKSDERMISLNLDDINFTMSVPVNYQSMRPEDAVGGVVPYINFFQDTSTLNFFGIFKGPNLEFTQEDLPFYTDYIEQQFGSKYDLVKSKYGNNPSCNYMLFRQQSTLNGSFREFYLISTHSKKYSIGVEALFTEESYSFEPMVRSAKIELAKD